MVVLVSYDFEILAVLQNTHFRYPPEREIKIRYTTASENNSIKILFGYKLHNNYFEKKIVTVQQRSPVGQGRIGNRKKRRVRIYNAAIAPPFEQTQKLLQTNL
ncbi:hypothetical protein ACE6ED_02285 [Paenibacillus sp. CN-4]|uniref:hypothetical protein n=1 Tax=Paenibacillus nanchangensis TaxID=3348343 RepID=UPI00397ACEAC